MNKLERMIKQERNYEYKRIRKLFQARDMASPYIKENIKMSQIMNHFKHRDITWMTTTGVAKVILDEKRFLISTRTTNCKTLQRTCRLTLGKTFRKIGRFGLRQYVKEMRECSTFN